MKRTLVIILILFFQCTIFSSSFLFQIAELYLAKKVCLENVFSGLNFDTKKLEENPITAHLLKNLCMKDFKAISKGDADGAQALLLYKDKELPIKLFITSEGNERVLSMFFGKEKILLGEIISFLKPLDELLEFSEVQLSFIGSSKIKIVSTLSLRGLSGAFKNNNVKLEVDIPRGADNVDRVSLLLSSGDAKPVELCMGKLFKSVGFSFDVDFFSHLFGNGCFVIEGLKAVVSKGAFGINFTSQVTLLGQNVTGIVRIAKEKTQTKPCIFFKSEFSETVKFSSLSRIFSPIDSLLSLKEPLFVIATCAADDGFVSTGSAQKGFTIYSSVTFNGFLGKFFGQVGLQDVNALVSMPLSPSLKDVRIEVRKDLKKPFSYGPIEMKSFALDIKGGTPPSGGLSIDSNVLFPNSKKIAVTLSGDINPAGFDLSGKALCRLADKSACPVVKNPYGFPLVVTDPRFTIHVAGGLLSGLGLGGMFVIGNADFDIDGDIDVKAPLKSTFDAKSNKFCLTDLATFWLYIANTLSKKIKAPQIKIPGLGCFEETEMHFSMKGGIPDVYLFTKFNFLGLKASAEGQMNIMGFSMDGEIEPIKVGSLLSITSANEEKAGPSIKIDFNLLEQQLYIEGLVKLFGSRITKKKQLRVSKEGLELDLDDSFFGIGVKLHLIVPPTKSVKSLTDWRVEGEINEGLRDLIIADTKKVVGVLQSEVTKAQDKVKTLNKKCSSLPIIVKQGCQALTFPARAFLSAAQIVSRELVDKMNIFLTTFAIKRAHFVCSLPELKSGKLPQVDFDIEFFGKKHTFTISNFDFKDSVKSMKKVTQEILKNFKSETWDKFKKALFAYKNAVKSLLPNVDLDNVSKTIEQIKQEEVQPTMSDISIKTDVTGLEEDLRSLEQLDTQVLALK